MPGDALIITVSFSSVFPKILVSLIFYIILWLICFHGVISGILDSSDDIPSK